MDNIFVSKAKSLERGVPSESPVKKTTVRSEASVRTSRTEELTVSSLAGTRKSDGFKSACE